MPRAFVDMATVLPQADIGDYRLSHVTIDEAWLQRWNDYLRQKGDKAGLREARTLRAGTYARLTNAYTGWMDDTHFERETNERFLQAAYGDVLIAGLGLGMLPTALLRDPSIRSVTVLEWQPEVIDLVYPHIREARLTVVRADATAPPLRGRAYDSIYLDIWPDVRGEHWPQMNALLKLYRTFRKPGGLVQAWVKGRVQRAYSQGRRPAEAART